MFEGGLAMQSDYYGEDTAQEEVRFIEAHVSQVNRTYQRWLAEQDEETQAEERLFRSNGL